MSENFHRSRIISDSLLIVRLSAIGDIVMASPLVHALRKKYPDAHLAWLVQPECAQLLRDHPGLDEVIIWQRQRWQQLLKERHFLTLLREIKTFRRQLHRHNFDLALDLQGLLKSGFLVWLSGAKRRIGLGSKEGSQRLMTEVIERGGEAGLIGSEYRYLAEYLDLPVNDFKMQIGIGNETERQLEQLKPSFNHPYAVICPFTTRPQKHWFEDAWIKLVAKLKGDYGLEVVMLGGPGDKPAAQSIADSCQLVNLAGETNLQLAAAIIRESALVVGVDTGLTHMGHAFLRPTVCLFGSTKPYLSTGTNQAHIIYHALECSPCKRSPTCDGAFTCMRDITTAEVLDAVTGLIGAGS